MATLTFQASDVRRVVEHALNNSTPTGATVLFVHDEGVYLMSGAQPRDIVQGETSFCAYAEGMNPDTDPDFYDAAHDAVCGDDFAETLPHQCVKSMKEWLDRGAQTIAIKLCLTSCTLTVEPRFGRGKSSHIAK